MQNARDVDVAVASYDGGEYERSERYDNGGVTYNRGRGSFRGRGSWSRGRGSFRGRGGYNNGGYNNSNYNNNYKNNRQQQDNQTNNEGGQKRNYENEHIKCYGCGGTGHVEKVCPTSQAKRQRQGAYSSIELSHDLPSSSSSSSLDLPNRIVYDESY